MVWYHAPHTGLSVNYYCIRRESGSMLPGERRYLKPCQTPEGKARLPVGPIIIIDMGCLASKGRTWIGSTPRLCSSDFCAISQFPIGSCPGGNWMVIWKYYTCRKRKDTGLSNVGETAGLRLEGSCKYSNSFAKQTPM